LSSIERVIAEVPIFEDFQEGEIRSIVPLFKERHYRKGTILFFEGDYGDEMYIVISGLVRIYRIEQNKEIILALFRSGDFFGEMALIDKTSTRSATAETIEPSTILSISRGDFYRFLEKSPRLLLRLLEVNMQRLRKANDQIHDLTFLDVRSRIVKAIARLAEEYGTPTPQGLFIDMRLTHQQIANLVGTVRESVTKVLQELQDDGIISIQQKRIMVYDLPRLKTYIQY